MKMSDGVEWAIHCAGLLAGLPEGRTLSGKALAEYHGVSESYLLKHLKAMVASGLFLSVSGPRGGFRLARPADEITYLHIVQAVDGLEPAFRCDEIRQRGPVEVDAETCRRPCAINVSMLRAEMAWRKALREETVGALARDLQATLPPRIQRETAAWLVANAR
ncbi:Rrf2 family transcriptional regulator [bacterium]|nr:MAG: Rrf2 family transcriptional regulator [bacterium]